MMVPNQVTLKAVLSELVTTAKLLSKNNSAQGRLEDSNKFVDDPDFFVPTNKIRQTL